jgi:hypothetical protein
VYSRIKPSHCDKQLNIVIASHLTRIPVPDKRKQTGTVALGAEFLGFFMSGLVPRGRDAHRRRVDVVGAVGLVVLVGLVVAAAALAFRSLAAEVVLGLTTY